MGQEESTLPPVPPPERLRDRSLKAVADYIKSDECKRVVFMVGAGISTAAGIPDFRSPSTGLYASLARLNLSHPEDVFDISFFRENPLPFYTLASELWPGKFAPTLTHHFISLFHRKQLLKRVFTQNIDTLELAAGIPEDLVTFAHGSFQTQSCIECSLPFPHEDMERAVLTATPAFCKSCRGLVKPDITFFGEGLPERFFQTKDEVDEADLAIVIGSSLSVYPFATLPQLVGYEVPRLLINMEYAGGIGGRREDVVWLGECDDAVMELARELGWWEELEQEWLATRRPEYGEVKEEGNREERLAHEVEKLTREVEKSLENAAGHEEWVKKQLDKDDQKRVKSVEATVTTAPFEEEEEKEAPVEEIPESWDQPEGDAPAKEDIISSSTSSSVAPLSKPVVETTTTPPPSAALTEPKTPQPQPQLQKPEEAPAQATTTTETITKTPTTTTLEDLATATEKLAL